MLRYEGAGADHEEEGNEGLRLSLLTVTGSGCWVETADSDTQRTGGSDAGTGEYSRLAHTWWQQPGPKGRALEPLGSCDTSILESFFHFSLYFKCPVKDELLLLYCISYIFNIYFSLPLQPRNIMLSYEVNLNVWATESIERRTKLWCFLLYENITNPQMLQVQKPSKDQTFYKRIRVCLQTERLSA